MEVIMSKLNFMEKLLDGVDVEWVELDSVFDIFAGGDVPKKSLSKVETKEFNIPILSNGIGDKALYGWTNKAKIEQPSLTISARGTIGWTNFVDKPFFPIVRLLVLTPRAGLNLKYAYYFMKTIENGYRVPPAGIPQLTKPMVKGVIFPIPCPENPKKSLEIQAEIVRILDTFTELTTELTTELNARKKQYNYYRDQLLSFEEGEVEWNTLGWIGNVRMCKRILKQQTSDSGEIPFFKIGTFGKEPNAYISRDIFEEYREKYNYPRVGEVLISASGTIGRAVTFDGVDAYFQDSNIVWLENDESKVLNKYLYYFYQIANWSVSDGGVIKRLYNDNIKKTLIPIPFPSDTEKSLAEQTRVVTILDKFDALTSSISEGLPREIALRQQQYEYYRDLLLSFPKPDSEVAA